MSIRDEYDEMTNEDYDQDLDMDFDDEDFDPDNFDEDEESSDTRECNCGKIGGCDWSIDECFEEGSDEDSLPCSSIGDDD